jgi:hypothetical protein
MSERALPSKLLIVKELIDNTNLILRDRIITPEISHATSLLLLLRLGGEVRG